MFVVTMGLLDGQGCRPGNGTFMPSESGMLIIASPPFAALGFVVGAVIGVILYAIVRANRQ